MAYVRLPDTAYFREKTRVAELEQNRELVRQYVRDSGLGQLSRAMLQAFVDRTDTLEGLKALCKSYSLTVKEEEWKMDKVTELKLLKEQQTALLKRIERLEFGKWGKEPANGSVFKIEKRFSSIGEKYFYAAIRAGGSWYLTGTRGEAVGAKTWEQLQTWVGKYARVWRMTTAEELLD